MQQKQIKIQGFSADSGQPFQPPPQVQIRVVLRGLCSTSHPTFYAISEPIPWPISCPCLRTWRHKRHRAWLHGALPKGGHTGLRAPEWEEQHLWPHLHSMTWLNKWSTLRSIHMLPGTKHCQEQPGVARSSQESSQEQPGAARSSQEQPEVASSSQ